MIGYLDVASTTVSGSVTTTTVVHVMRFAESRGSYGKISQDTPFRSSLLTRLSLSLPGNHPCMLPCHAPAACSEAEPCRATVTLSCPCGRIKQPVSCGRSTSNPAGREGSQQLKCTNECLVAKRNARLAEALGINTEAKTAQVTYSDELIAFGRANMKFCLLVEKTFAEYAQFSCGFLAACIDYLYHLRLALSHPRRRAKYCHRCQSLDGPLCITCVHRRS